MRNHKNLQKCGASEECNETWSTPTACQTQSRLLSAGSAIRPRKFKQLQAQALSVNCSAHEKNVVSDSFTVTSLRLYYRCIEVDTYWKRIWNTLSYKLLYRLHCMKKHHQTCLATTLWLQIVTLSKIDECRGRDDGVLGLLRGAAQRVLQRLHNLAPPSLITPVFFELVHQCFENRYTGT